MSYAICRMQKMKAYDLKGMQFHNQRERESQTNPDIDPEKGHLNEDLVNQEKIDYNQRVKQIIESQKTGTRKTRKDAVVVNELMVTSNRDFFDRLDPEEEERFFEKSYEWLSERYGQQNIAYAVVHRDEKTPHMHMGVVPMRDGKLQGKNVFNRQELRTLQDEFPKHLKELHFNLKRGEKGSNREHLTTQDLKAKTLKEQVKNLETELGEKTLEKQEAEASMKAIKDRLSDLKDASETMKKVDQVEVKDGGFFASKTVKLDREDYEGVKTLAKASETLRSENKALQKENLQLRETNADLKQQTSQMKRYKKERDTYKRRLDMLAKLVNKMHAFYKEHQPKALKAFERAMGYCKQKVNQEQKGLKPFQFEKQGTEHQREGFSLGVKEQKQKQKQMKQDRGLGR